MQMAGPALEGTVECIVKCIIEQIGMNGPAVERFVVIGHQRGLSSLAPQYLDRDEFQGSLNEYHSLPRVRMYYRF
jgi:hypothetical protein